MSEEEHWLPKLTDEFRIRAVDRVPHPPEAIGNGQVGATAELFERYVRGEITFHLHGVFRGTRELHHYCAVFVCDLVHGQVGELNLLPLSIRAEDDVEGVMLVGDVHLV